MGLFYPALQRATNANGAPKANYKWYFYLQGTTTPTPVYSDPTAVTSLGSNITSNASGLFNSGNGVYLDEAVATRAVLKDDVGATLQDIPLANGSDTASIAEIALDAVSAALVAGENVVISPDDPGDTITISAPTAGSPALNPSASGVFFDTATGDLFTEMSCESDATLTVSGSSLAFSSASQKELDCFIKDSTGAVAKFAFDNITIDATYTITSFPAADIEGVFTGTLDDAGGGTSWLNASLIKAHPGGAAIALGSIYNVGSQLATDAGGGYAFGAPFSVRSQYSRNGNIATHTLTYPATADRTMQVTQVFAATSYETPRLAFNAGIRFRQGVITATALKVSAGYPNATYACVGDSLTQGRNASTYADGWVSKLRVDYPDNVLNCGAPSATTAYWLDMTQPVIDMSPRYAFVCLGTNDLNTGVSLATLQTNYTTIMDRFTAAGITPVAISLPPFNNGNIPTFNAWLQAQGWIYIDIYSGMVGTGTSLSATYDSGDGLHWNTAGHNYVYGTITSAIATYSLTVPANVFYVDTDPLLAADSDTNVPSQKAIKQYVDDRLEAFVLNVGDQTTDLTTGTGKLVFRMPYAFTVSAVRANVSTAPAGSTIIVDINDGGTTILSTKLTIDAGEKTSTTAAAAYVLSDTALADDAEISIDIDQIGSGTAGKGLKVVLIGRRA